MRIWSVAAAKHLTAAGWGRTAAAAAMRRTTSRTCTGSHAHARDERRCEIGVRCAIREDHIHGNLFLGEHEYAAACYLALTVMAYKVKLIWIMRDVLLGGGPTLGFAHACLTPSGTRAGRQQVVTAHRHPHDHRKQPRELARATNTLR